MNGDFPASCELVWVKMDSGLLWPAKRFDIDSSYTKVTNQKSSDDKFSITPCAFCVKLLEIDRIVYLSLSDEGVKWMRKASKVDLFSTKTFGLNCEHTSIYLRALALASDSFSHIPHSQQESKLSSSEYNSHTTHAISDLNPSSSEIPIVNKSQRTLKRSNALSWDDYFMSVAFLSSMRSKDPSTQVGACIVNSDQRIVGIGYNGFPRGCNDDELPWDREAENELDTKYPYVCHAEVNSILNKNSADVNGCTMYVALFPCNECSKIIIQSGIRQIVYMSDKYHNTNNMIASRRMLDMAGVLYRQLPPPKEKIVIDFSV